MRQIENDMYQLFVDRLRMLICDTGDTCQRVDINPKAIIEIMISGLMGELLKAFITLELTEEELTKALQVGYRVIMREMKKNGR